MEQIRVLEKKGRIYDPTTQHHISDEYCPNAQNEWLQRVFQFCRTTWVLWIWLWSKDSTHGPSIEEKIKQLSQAAWVGLQSKQKRQDNKQTRGVERTICHQPQKQICLGRTAGRGRRWRREVSEPGLELPDSSPSPSLATSTPACQSSLLHFSVAPKPSSSPATTQILGLIFFSWYRAAVCLQLVCPTNSPETPGIYNKSIMLLLLLRLLLSLKDSPAKNFTNRL